MSIGAADGQIVEEVIAELTGDEKMFTAFDVSVEAKKRGAQCRHRDMKSAIHEVLRYNNDYSRKPVYVSGASGRPYVYYPGGADPEEYEPMDRSQFDDADTAKTSHSSGRGSFSSSSSSSCDQTDKRGRYCIKSTIVAGAGFDRGDSVSIHVNTDAIHITPTHISLAADVSKTYKVDKDRNIRISKRLLKKAFGESFISIDCEVDGDKIVVECN